MSGVIVRAARDRDGRELNRLGRLRQLFKAAIEEGDGETAERARQLIDAYHAAHGTAGRVASNYGEARASTSTPRGGSLLADIASARRLVADLTREATRARADAIRDRQRAGTSTGGRQLVYDDDAFDDLDFTEVVSEAEYQRQVRLACG